MGAKDKVLKQLTTVLVTRDRSGGGSTVLEPAGAGAGTNSLPVSSGTNFANGDLIRVGSGETTELAIIATGGGSTVLTLADALTHSHVGGEPVVEQEAFDVGDVTDAGATVNAGAETQDVQVATKRLAYTVLNGYSDLAIGFALPGFALHNLAIALGMAFSRIAGNGTVGNPLSLVTDGSEIASEANQSVIAMGVTMDGSVIRIELWGVDPDYTQLRAQLARGVLGSVPCRFVAAAGGVVTTNASAYVPNTTNRPAKGKVFDSLTEVGLFVDAATTPFSQTLSGAEAAGSKVLEVAATTNAANDDWVRVGSGDTVEFHQIASVQAGVSITLKTGLYRAHAAGTAVVEQSLTPFAGVSPDGVAYEVTGSVETIRIATRRLSAGLKPGNAAQALRFAVQDLTLANFARALGIPAAQIVSNRLPITGEKIATDTVQGVYVRGVLQDGTVAWVQLWGCAQDVSAFATTLAATGVPSLPIAFKPSSGVHFMQHAS